MVLPNEPEDKFKCPVDQSHGIPKAKLVPHIILCLCRLLYSIYYIFMQHFKAYLDEYLDECETKFVNRKQGTKKESTQTNEKTSPNEIDSKYERLEESGAGQPGECKVINNSKCGKTESNNFGKLDDCEAANLGSVAEVQEVDACSFGQINYVVDETIETKHEPAGQFEEDANKYKVESAATTNEDVSEYQTENGKLLQRTKSSKVNVAGEMYKEIEGENTEHIEEESKYNIEEKPNNTFEEIFGGN